MGSCNVDSEVVQSLREMDRHLLEKLSHIELRLEKIEDDVQKEIHDIKADLEEKISEERRINDFITHSIQKIMDRQQQQAPVMEKLQTVIGASIAMKWVMGFVLVALGAIATTGSAIEVVRGWFWK